MKNFPKLALFKKKLRLTLSAKPSTFLMLSLHEMHRLKAPVDLYYTMQLFKILNNKSRRRLFYTNKNPKNYNFSPLLQFRSYHAVFNSKS